MSRNPTANDSVAARSFAVHFRGRHAEEGYDLCGTTHCQRLEPDLVTERLQSLADKTAGELLWYAGKPVFAWSGGAMAVCDRVVLFHDDPPQGPGASEVLDHGLGLVPDLVSLPQPEERLQLESTDRVRILAQRFAPALCLALPSRSSVVFQKGRFLRPDGVIELREDGSHGPFSPLVPR